MSSQSVSCFKCIRIALSRCVNFTSYDPCLIYFENGILVNFCEDMVSYSITRLSPVVDYLGLTILVYVDLTLTLNILTLQVAMHPYFIILLRQTLKTFTY